MILFLLNKGFLGVIVILVYFVFIEFVSRVAKGATSYMDRGEFLFGVESDCERNINLLYLVYIMFFVVVNVVIVDCKG